MDDAHTPVWLKEVLKRGFKPEKIYHELDTPYYSYIKSNSEQIIKSPICKTFTLEGLPGAGKTSLLAQFKDNKQTHTIQQILPEDPVDDQKMTQEFYYRSEELKTEEYRNTTDAYCLLDRYYVSTLAFYWASDKINHTSHYANALSWYQHAKQKRIILPPFTVFLIKVTVNLSLQRKSRTQNDPTGNIWTNLTFLSYFDKYYEYFYKEIEPYTKVIRLDGNRPLTELASIIAKEMYDEKD